MQRLWLLMWTLKRHSLRFTLILNKTCAHALFCFQTAVPAESIYSHLASLFIWSRLWGCYTTGSMTGVWMKYSWTDVARKSEYSCISTDIELCLNKWGHNHLSDQFDIFWHKCIYFVLSTLQCGMFLAKLVGFWQPFVWLLHKTMTCPHFKPAYKAPIGLIVFKPRKRKWTHHSAVAVI